MFSYIEKKEKMVLVQHCLNKTLSDNQKSAKHTSKNDDNLDDMNLKAEIKIQLCPAYKITYDRMDKTIITGLWSRLESLYITKEPV